MNSFEMYEAAVQSPDHDVKFLSKMFIERRTRIPFVLAEDFCASFALSRAWCELSAKHTAIATDLDPKPLHFGKLAIEKSLDEFPDLGRRLKIRQANVLAPAKDRCDIINALNFSYFALQKRNDLKTYFSRCIKRLKPDGILFLDHIGGERCMSENAVRRRNAGVEVIWELKKFDPIQNRGQFYLHLKHQNRKSKKTYRSKFHYDWRLWSIPEIRELLHEVGFQKTTVLWEGSDRKGNGNSKFRAKESAEACLTWIAYIMAER